MLLGFAEEKIGFNREEELFDVIKLFTPARFSARRDAVAIHAIMALNSG